MHNTCIYFWHEYIFENTWICRQDMEQISGMNFATNEQP